MKRDTLPNAFVDDLVSALRTALGSELLAVYLYGSLVVGGFEAGVSDVDLLVVTGRDLDSVAFERLATVHSAILERHPEWEDRLELVYVGRETLARFREGGRLAVVSPGEPFHQRDGIELWVGDFYLTRETGVTLLGLGPTELIPEISRDEFLMEIQRYADEVRSRDRRVATPDARAYDVLTMCRALATLTAGKPCSKQQGASMVRSAMPEWAWLIDEAERCRLSRGQTGLAGDAAIMAAESFVALVGERIAASEALAASRLGGAERPRP